jgi:protein required for attachment to host cells
MTIGRISHEALVVVADGTGARLFRNTGNATKVVLKADGEVNPTAPHDDGPSGKRPPEMSQQEMEEATFAKHLAKDLYRRAHGGEFDALVIVADPQTLGQMRPLLHKEVHDKIVAELAKTLTKAPLHDIEAALNKLP